MKRKNYSSWDTLFINIAEEAAKRSKDPSTIHGCCIVRDNKLLSIGYNGLPKGFDDSGIDITTEPLCEDFLKQYYKETGNRYYDYWDKANKYHFSCHAEENGILNSKQDITGSTLYLYSEKGYYPCEICARMITQSGIKEVVMKTAIKESTEVYNWEYTKHTFKKAKVKIRILNV
jgi:dCMP deaminase